MKYKLHMAYANRDDMAVEAVQTVRDIGQLHVWPNGDNAERLLVPTYSTLHTMPPMAPVSLINCMIRESWHDDVMFWMHNDAFAKPGVAQRLLDHVIKLHEGDTRWGAVFTCYDVLCAFNMKAVREIGYWDAMFFQYTADVEFYGRMRKAGWTIDESTFGKDDVEHRGGSITVQSDPTFNLRTQWRERTNFDKMYHQFKWGSFPGAHLQFNTPFNGKTEKFQ